MTSTTVATVSYVDCVDITEMSEQELSELLGIPSRQEAGDNVMLQVLNLLEHGRSQTLTVENLQVIKSYVDEMLGC